ncbi:MAG: pyridoxal-phosphate dependent enzyme [Chloroflexi bacterium]|nr:pyridoxal-phosphate dependent enzyme [Chloroflexota bacterium]
MLPDKLERYPRIPLAEYPTPLEPLPRLSEKLGRRVFVKRDDEIGPAMGGSKTRKLEYFFAEARALRVPRIVTFGGLQSNHARLTAGVARQLGFEPHLLYFDRRPASMEGNLLVNSLLGAEMHFIPIGGGGNAHMTLETSNRLVRWLARLLVGQHYFIPVGGHSWLGGLGYVRAAVEIERQARELGIENAWLVLAAGTGGTLAGLLAGLTLIKSNLRPLAIDVGRLWKKFPESIARMATRICFKIGQAHSFTPEQIPILEGNYVGVGYALPTRECADAIIRLARLEGLVLDPVYTGKAFAGLLDLMEKGELGSDEPVIFLHTGGTPSLFPLGQNLLETGLGPTFTNPA